MLARVQQQRQPPSGQRRASEPELEPPREAGVARFDPADGGSYPCRRHLHAAVWQDVAASQDARGEEPPAPAASGGDDARANPFGWVPDEDGAEQPSGAIGGVRPRTAQIRSRTATSLPLELFDSPEMEGVDVGAALRAAAAAGADGVPALSRFFAPDGAFSWQPCTVLAYDE